MLFASGARPGPGAENWTSSPRSGPPYPLLRATPQEIRPLGLGALLAFFLQPTCSLQTHMSVEAMLVPHQRIERAILLIRGHKVILDADLAVLYAVETRALVQAVKRNMDRFPDDFMFKLSRDEYEALKSQNVIPNPEGRGGRRTTPYAFTEQGIAMLSSVLRSERAVQVNIQIMRTFVSLREMLAENETLSRKLAALERKYDRQLKAVFDAIRELMTPAAPKPRRRIGFRSDDSL